MKLVTAGTLAVLWGASDAATVEPRVHRALKQQGIVNLIVTMRDRPASVLDRRLEESTFASRGDLIADAFDKLKAHAATSQAEVVKLMAQESSLALASEVKSFWISNQILFRDATIELVEKLARMEGVASIEEEQVYPAPHVDQTADAVPSRASDRSLQANGDTDVAWGVAQIKAPEVWAKGFNGQGIVVGTIDTGVRGSHVALRANYRGAYGWFDPVLKSAEPIDWVGHGTIAIGSIVGTSKGTGVAPGAKWMSCMGCSKAYGCRYSDLLTCAQFMTCPTDTNGNNADCSKAPNVVNNSWGGGQGDQGYAAVVNAWIRLGIVPVFGIGNSGPTCGSATSPGDLPNVIGVGATTSWNTLKSDSSRGPSVNGYLKPEIVAPGNLIFTTSADGDDQFVSASGTSTAAPHVTGVVVLLLSARPSLTNDAIRDVLFSTTDQSPLQPVAECSGASDKFPNNMFGFGRVNALAAMEKLQQLPRPGECAGRGDESCNGAFFCSWNQLKKTCQRWW